MVFKSHRHTKQQRKSPHFPFQVVIKTNHHKKHGKDIILAEYKLTEDSNRKYQKRKFAKPGFLLSKSYFHANFVHKVRGHIVKDDRKQLIPHIVNKAVRQDRFGDVTCQIQRQIPYRISKKGTWQIIGVISAGLLIACFIKICKMLIHQKRTISGQAHIPLHTNDKQNQKHQTGNDPVQFTQFVRFPQFHSIPVIFQAKQRIFPLPFLFHFHFLPPIPQNSASALPLPKDDPTPSC